MGVDMYCCENCRDVLHSDCFRQCEVCFDKLDNCDGCDEDNLIKEKEFNNELYIKNTEEKEIKGSTVKIHIGKGKKDKILRKRIILCDDCIKIYHTKYVEEECDHRYVCVKCDKKL